MKQGSLFLSLASTPRGAYQFPYLEQAELKQTRQLEDASGLTNGADEDSASPPKGGAKGVKETVVDEKAEQASKAIADALMATEEANKRLTDAIASGKWGKDYRIAALMVCDVNLLRANKGLGLFCKQPRSPGVQMVCFVMEAAWPCRRMLVSKDVCLIGQKESM
jgi:hypothetical protein